MWQKITFILTGAIICMVCSCTKDSLFDYERARDGQIVTIYLDHYMDAYGDRIFSDEMYTNGVWGYVSGFDDRELGYRYAIKARVQDRGKNIQDAPRYSFIYQKTLKKVKAENEPFLINLSADMGSGLIISIAKPTDTYLFGGRYPLVPTDGESVLKLEEAIQAAGRYREGKSYSLISAIVSHDPDAWGNTLRVHDVTIQETPF